LRQVDIYVFSANVRKIFGIDVIHKPSVFKPLQRIFRKYGKAEVKSDIPYYMLNGYYGKLDRNNIKKLLLLVEKTADCLEWHGI
jgi:hypothetical protein